MDEAAKDLLKGIGAVIGIYSVVFGLNYALDRYQTKKLKERADQFRDYFKNNSTNANSGTDTFKRACRIFNIDPSQFRKINRAELKKIYRRMVKIYHPDAGGSEELFRDIQDAYETLKQYSHA